MACGEFHYFNQALGKMESVQLILPETARGDGPFPVMLLLHGLSDNHSVWMRRTSIERYVEGLPLIVAMPDGGRSFYLDAPGGPDYDTALARDLMAFLDTRFNTLARREGRVVCGLSMGGYGAVHLALAHPELFCAAASHSGAVAYGHVNFGERSDEGVAERFTIEAERILGRTPKGGPADLFALAERLPESARPALRLDCGRDDFLIEDNRAFHRHLERIGYPHEYSEFPGEHNWAYWDQHVQESIAFFARILGLA